MVRKVGFDTGKTRKGVADRVLDEHRARARAKRDAEAAAAQKATDARAARPRRKWGTIFFLSLWLAGWSVGVLFVGLLILAGEADTFLYVWEFFALIGWVVVVLILVKLIRNR